MKALLYQILQDCNNFENFTYSIIRALLWNTQKNKYFIKQENILSTMVTITCMINDSQYVLIITLK